MPPIALSGRRTHWSTLDYTIGRPSPEEQSKKKGTFLWKRLAPRGSELIYGARKFL
jgi:hypothetical protein